MAVDIVNSLSSRARSVVHVTDHQAVRPAAISRADSLLAISRLYIQDILLLQ
jgi:hypothetical protein